jgi:hypothetical protein
MRAVFGKTLAAVLVAGIVLVAPASPALAATGRFISNHDGRCLDADKPDAASQAHDGTVVQVWQCWGGNNQEWTWYTDGTIRPTWNHAFCLDEDVAGGTHDGTKVQLWTCNGWDNQKWDFHFDTDNTIVSRHDGRCLDEDINGGTRDGSRAQVWSCNKQDNQQWHR